MLVGLASNPAMHICIRKLGLKVFSGRIFVGQIINSGLIIDNTVCAKKEATKRCVHISQGSHCYILRDSLHEVTN